MRTFKKTCAQGDIYVRRIDKLPKEAIEVPAEGEHVVVTHSETGHHHVMERRAVTMYRLPDEIYDCFLVVNEPTTLDHLRPHDTHESIKFEKGTYHVRRQREHTPEGFRRVED